MNRILDWIDEITGHDPEDRRVLLTLFAIWAMIGAVVCSSLVNSEPAPGNNPDADRIVDGVRSPQDIAREAAEDVLK